MLKLRVANPTISYVLKLYIKKNIKMFICVRQGTNPVIRFYRSPF